MCCAKQENNDLYTQDCTKFRTIFFTIMNEIFLSCKHTWDGGMEIQNLICIDLLLSFVLAFAVIVIEVILQLFGLCLMNYSST